MLAALLNSILIGNEQVNNKWILRFCFVQKVWGSFIQVHTPLKLISQSALKEPPLEDIDNAGT